MKTLMRHLLFVVCIALFTHGVHSSALAKDSHGMHKTDALLVENVHELHGSALHHGIQALAIQCDDPAKKWHCHQYGCGKGGNLVGLCDLMKPGPNAGGGSVHGERFKDIRADLLAMAGGYHSAHVLNAHVHNILDARPPHATFVQNAHNFHEAFDHIHEFTVHANNHRDVHRMFP